MSQALRPSEVRFSGTGFMLPNMLDKAELEFAAFLIIRYCAEVNEDKWENPVDVKRLVGWIRLEAKLHGKERAHWSRNPLFRPDFHGLATSGFAEFEFSAPDPEAPLTLEMKQLKLLPVFFERLEAQQLKHFGPRVPQ